MLLPFLSLSLTSEPPSAAEINAINEFLIATNARPEAIVLMSTPNQDNAKKLRVDLQALNALVGYFDGCGSHRR